MQIRTPLTSAALGLFGSAVRAQSAATIDDAAIKADDTAEAKAAESVEGAAAARERREAAKAAKWHAEQVSGDMNPVDEGDAAQMKQDK